MPNGLSRAALQEIAGPEPYEAAAAQGSQYRPAERKPLSRAGLQGIVDYKPQSFVSKVGETAKGIGSTLGGAAGSMAELGLEFTGIPEITRTVGALREGRSLEGTGRFQPQVKEQVAAIKEKGREILSPEEEKRAAGAGGLSPRMQSFERAAKLLGLPLEALGLPVVSTGEALGRAGAGDPRAMGEAAALAGLTALGTRGLGKLGARAVPEGSVLGGRFHKAGAPKRAGVHEWPPEGVHAPPDPSARPVAPGVGPRAQGAGRRAGAPGPEPPPKGAPGEPPPSAEAPPTGRPKFFWEHEPAVHAERTATGYKVHLKNGKTIDVDAAAFEAEVVAQGSYPRWPHRGKTVVDHQYNSSGKRHKIWYEDGSSNFVGHEEFVRATKGRFQQGAAPGAPEEGPIPPPPSAEAPPGARTPGAEPMPRGQTRTPPRGGAPISEPPIVEPRALGRRPAPGARPLDVAAGEHPAGAVAPPGAVPRPARSRPGRDRSAVKFNPEQHSLSDFARQHGLRFGKGTSIPAELADVVGNRGLAGRLFRFEETGLSADQLLTIAKEEGGFNIPQDMTPGDFLRLIGEDWQAKAAGGDTGRTWSGQKQFLDEPGIEPPPEVQALPEVSRSEILQRIDDAVQKGDADAEAQWRERIAIMDEQAPLEPGAMDFPPEDPISARAGISQPPRMSSDLAAALEAATGAVEGRNLPPAVTQAQAALPPVPEGSVRLWRWEGPGAVRAGAAGAVKGGGWFEKSSGAYYSEGMGPEAGRYLDIPEAEFQRYAGDPNATEVQLPAELVAQSKPLVGEALGAGAPTDPNIMPPSVEGPLTPADLRNAKLSLRSKGHLFPPLKAVHNEALARRGKGLTGPPETDPVSPGQEGWIDLGDIIKRFRPKPKHGPAPTTPAYDKILQDRELARAVAPWHQKALEWATDLPVEVERRIFNQDVRIHRLVDAIERETGRKIPADQDPRIILDLVRGGTTGRMQWATLAIAEARKAVIKDGLLSHTVSYLDLMGWKRAIKIIEENVAAAFKAGDSQRVAELLERLRNSEVAPQYYNTEKINAHLKELEGSLSAAAWESVKRHASALWDINRKMWDLVHAQEMISTAIWQQGIARGNEYIPLHRLHEAFQNDPDWAGVSSLNAATRRALNRLEGSVLSTGDPYGNSHMQATWAIRDAGKNEAMRVVHDLKNHAPAEWGAGLIEDLPTPDARPRAGYKRITYYSKGIKRAFAMPEAIAHSLIATGPQEIGMLVKAAQYGRRALQVGAVSANLAFAAPNIPRDIGRFWALSKASSPLNPMENARLLKSLGQGLGHVIRQDAWYMEMLWHRAAGTTMGKQLYPEVWMETPWTKKFSHKVIHSIPQLINITEELSKAASFRKLREMGYGPEEAASETQNYAGTPNWGRRGSDTAMLNLMMPFFNVTMQGKAAGIRRWRRMPARLFVTGIGMALGALSLYAWNAMFRDDEGNAEWNHVPKHDKKNNWIILSDQINPETGRHAYYMIRKPEELQAIYNPIELGLWEVAGQTEMETRDYYQMLIDSASATIPGVPDIELTAGESVPHAVGRNVGMGLNPVARIPIEQYGGTDLFRNRPMVPRSLQDVDPEYQYTERTSPTAVVAGQATGISPMRVEHGFHSFGGLGEQILGLVDPVAERYSPQKPGLYRGAEETPVVGSVIRRVYRGGFNDQIMKDYEELFYSYLDEANEVVATMSELERDPEQMWKYYLDDPKRRVLRLQQPRLREIATNLRELREIRRDTLANPAMSDEEKGQRSQALLQQQIQLVQYATMFEKMIEEAGEPSTPPALAAPAAAAPP